MNEIQLDPCPFCHNFDIMLLSFSGYNKAECSKCGASMSESGDVINVIKKWNTRIPCDVIMIDALNEQKAYNREMVKRIEELEEKLRRKEYEKG